MCTKNLVRPLLFLTTVFTLTLTAHTLHAATVHIATPSQHEQVTVDDVSLSKRYAGVLADAPHLYAFTLTQESTVEFAIHVPAAQREYMRGLLLRVLDGGSVEEVARVEGREGDAQFSALLGMRVRESAIYRGSLPPGVYQFEVSTPTNRGPYMLVSHVNRESWWSEYMSSCIGLYRIYTAFGYSHFWILLSSLVWAPLVLLIFGVTVWYVGYKKKTPH
jgi:hypothetical protein